MSETYEFVQLDVFTRKPLTGNPLAIFTDARGLSDQQMQTLAREMNLSETTFILPREPEVEAEEGKRVRIFTVEEELPFAGHPTLGTALYLHSTAAPGADEILFDLNVGKIGVRFSTDSNNRSNGVAGDVFGEMRQRDPEFGPILSQDKIASGLRGGAREIASEWPSQVVSTGLPFAIVPIRDSKTLANLTPDLVRVGAVLEGAGARFCYFICPEERQGRLEVRARMFFYGGEDPATGSAAGVLSVGWCGMAWQNLTSRF
jgi:trans-2,3-dihydro-3-hydroxyanthranilate isomerase